jgi:large subunit ribosomal protein L7/L12
MTEPMRLGEEEQTGFDVVLESFGEKKINVIKALREQFPCLGLKEAEALKAALEEAGGVAIVR